MQFPRPERIRKLMHDEGLAEMQAINVCRMRDAVHAQFRRNPREFDFRFGGSL